MTHKISDDDGDDDDSIRCGGVGCNQYLDLHITVFLKGADLTQLKEGRIE